MQQEPVSTTAPPFFVEVYPRKWNGNAAQKLAKLGYAIITPVKEVY